MGLFSSKNDKVIKLPRRVYYEGRMIGTARSKGQAERMIRNEEKRQEKRQANSKSIWS